MRDPVNNLLFLWPQKFGLKKVYRTFNRISELTNKYLLDLYNERYNKYDESDLKNAINLNIIDLMIAHNKKCQKTNKLEDIIDEENIIGNFKTLIFGGYDTSLTSSISCLMTMAQKNRDWIKKIQKDGLDSISSIESNQSLDLAIKEVLRFANPVAGGIGRTVMKKCTIAGVELPKGTLIHFGHAFNSLNTQYVNGGTFNPLRFKEEVPKLERYFYHPFGEGKRKCIGYSLGNINMKLLMGYTLNKTSIEVDEDYQVKFVNKGIYSCANPIVKMRLR